MRRRSDGLAQTEQAAERRAAWQRRAIEVELALAPRLRQRDQRSSSPDRSRPAAVNTVKNWKFWPTICCARKVSSLTKITEAIEVTFSMLIVLLDIPGRIARIACGRMIRRIVSERSHAQRARGDGLLAVHRQDAAADDLGAERGLVQREAEHGGGETVEPDADAGSAS